MPMPSVSVTDWLTGRAAGFACSTEMTADRALPAQSEVLLPRLSRRAVLEREEYNDYGNE